MNKADPLKKNDSSRTGYSSLSLSFSFFFKYLFNLCCLSHEIVFSESTILALAEEKYTLPTSLGISAPG